MGGMSKSGKGGRFGLGQNAEINVTPFVDVMLVLLIIFMVAAPLPTVSIKADIPPPPPRPMTPKSPPVIVNVQRGGVFIGQEPVAVGMLAAQVRLRLGADAGARVLVHADRDVAYRDFMAVMNELNGHGLSKIALVAEDL